MVIRASWRWWSEYAEGGDQCMLNVVISVGWRWWSVWAGGGDQCGLEVVIRANWRWWSEITRGGDQSILKVVIRACWSNQVSKHTMMKFWGIQVGAMPCRGLLLMIFHGTSLSQYISSSMLQITLLTILTFTYGQRIEVTTWKVANIKQVLFKQIAT